MPEISDERYAHLLKRSAGYGQLRTVHAQLKDKLAKLETSHTETNSRLAEIESEASELRVKAAAPASADERVEALTAELRGIKHKTAFAKLAKGKVRDEAVEDLYSLSGYKPEADDVDEAALGSLIEAEVAKRPFLAPPVDAPGVPAKPGAPTKTAVTAPIAAAEGATRGQQQQSTPDITTRVNAAYAATGRPSDVPGRI